MASIIGNLNNVITSGETPPPWMAFDWNSKVQHDIYRDWGTYYSNRRRENFALHYFTQALNLDDSDWSTLFRRSLTRRKAAQLDEALADAMRANSIAERKAPNCPINMQICDAIFEQNNFEKSDLEIKRNIRKFIGVKSMNFETRRVVVDGIIEDVTGKGLSLFYLKNQKTIEHVSAMLKAKEIVDERPLWKILKELEKCDILSIPEEEIERLSPLEIARRKRAFNVIHQTYLNNSWHDVLFLKQLRNNPSLLLEQCKNSRHFLSMLSKKQYDIIRRFLKMIHCRSPLYLVNYLKYPNKAMLEKNKEAYLYRIQYQTHRNMIADLRVIRKLRANKSVKRLAEYVEKIMGDYYVTKTNRVMCWKFQFYCEVYNTLALTIAEQYSAPEDISYVNIFSILQMKPLAFKEIVPFVFGDRSTYQDGDAIDPQTIRARHLISRLEKRVQFANYSIEKCYLYHQIASVQLSQLHYDECCLYARRAIKESQNCNSLIYKFLSFLQIIKANVLQYKVEKTKEATDEAVPIAIELKSPRLIKFIKTILHLTDAQLKRKIDSICQQKGKMSVVEP